MHSKSILFYSFIILFISIKCHSQNLPSLLLEKNINATFSILAYDESNQEWGIAVATNNIYVGNSTIYIEPGVGAFSVIAETEPKYAQNGFINLKAGKSIQEAIELTKEKDEEWFYRQVSGVDAKGNVYAFTGSDLKYWQGISNHKTGQKFVVMGNQLADGVLEAMFNTFEKSEGTLAQKLLKSLIAGQQAGGQIQGKQSAALVVKGSKNEWFNNIDLRVDHSAEPFQDLQKLLDYHYARITLNQATFAIRNKKTERGRTLLSEAETKLEGWNGMYSKIALAHLLLGEEKEAVRWIRKGLAENPSWAVNLPAFYLIKDVPEAKGLIDENSFNEKDWASALTMLINVGKSAEATKLSDNLIKKMPSSLLFYLSAKAYAKAGNKEIAMERSKKALQQDLDNELAKKLITELN